MKAKIITSIPGPRSRKLLRAHKLVNGGWGAPHPFVHSHEGSGCYFKDIDGNTFLDFASQVASLPLGYNHPDVKEVVRQYARFSPVKYAGQDFLTKEHQALLEELIAIPPAGMNAAFLINSGAEATENAIKICMRKKKMAKYCVSFEGAFHGRTLGALSLTDTKRVHKEHYFSIPTKRLPFTDEAGQALLDLLEREVSLQEIACVIMEPIQGEGGYNFASKKMMKDIRLVTKQKRIPLIMDEVQSGLGRTGRWWAHQHFSIKPEVIAAAKALQVGATIANKQMFPSDVGAISSTWGGGHIIDMAVAVQIIKTIKRRKLLSRTSSMGKYLLKGLHDMSDDVKGVSNPRGLGLMTAVDLPSARVRNNVILEAAKRGLVVLGCGKQSIRFIPPYIIDRDEIDEGLHIFHDAVIYCSQSRFRHRGEICHFMGCGEHSS
jgi:4-aminobutyrate aminotransferase